MVKLNAMKNNTKIKTLIRIITIIISIIAMIVFYSKESNNYFQKAVMICTQCIGLG